MKKTAFFTILLFLAAILFSSCSFGTETAEKTGFFFDTFVDVKLYGQDEKLLNETIENCFAELSEIDSTFSAENPDSELSKLNESAFNSPVKISDELFYVIKTALHYCELSDGALDISIGELIDTWGIGTENQRIPSEDEINSLSGVSYKDIVLDENEKTIFFTDERVKINLGAVAKGYAGDKMLEILSESGASGAVFNLGGNIITFGSKPDGTDFTIGIANPKDNENIIGTVLVGTSAIVTSGDYQRFFVENGKVYHHILDAKTGYPSESGLSGVTIICGNSTEADCLSTAVFVLGKEKGLELIESLPEAEAVLIENDGEIFASSGIENYSYSYVGSGE